MEDKTIDREAVLNSLVLNNSTIDGQPRKRRRLDNLSVEERALRRKLKNRVAAQTARDRKKARMTDLEEAVEKLEKQNKALRQDNDRLRKHSEAVAIENSELRVRLGLTPPVSPEPVLTHSYPPSPEIASPQEPHSPVVIKKESEYTEFASLSVSQQQERLILFLSVITTWMMMNGSLTWLLACLNFMKETTLSPSSSLSKKMSPVSPVASIPPPQSQTRKSATVTRQSQKPAAVT